MIIYLIQKYCKVLTSPMGRRTVLRICPCSRRERCPWTRRWRQRWSWTGERAWSAGEASCWNWKTNYNLISTKTRLLFPWFIIYNWRGNCYRNCNPMTWETRFIVDCIVLSKVWCKDDLCSKWNNLELYWYYAVLIWSYNLSLAPKA